MSFSQEIQPLKYPKEIKTLGDHLLARRLDKKLYQKDVGKILGVDGNTILNWENNYSEPGVKYYPKIMEFLGYCPIHYAKNFGDRIKLHRTHRGLSHRQFGKIINADPGTISRWENEKRKPMKKHREALHTFFNDDQ